VRLIFDVGQSDESATSVGHFCGRIARHSHDEVFSSMTFEARSRLSLHAPEQLVAFLYASSPPIGAFRIGTEREQGAQHATITGDLLFENGTKVTVDFNFHAEAGGWRFILDEANTRDLLDNWKKPFGTTTKND
jgi:hypothetical protein